MSYHEGTLTVRYEPSDLVWSLTTGSSDVTTNRPTFFTLPDWPLMELDMELDERQHIECGNVTGNTNKNLLEDLTSYWRYVLLEIVGAKSDCHFPLKCLVYFINATALFLPAVVESNGWLFAFVY